MVEEMPHEEFLGWEEYFSRRPIGWRDDQRTFKLLQAWGIKHRDYEIFDSLAAIRRSIVPSISEDGRISGTALKSSPFFGRMMQAKGGDKLEL